MRRRDCTRNHGEKASPQREGPASGWKVRRNVLRLRTEIRVRAHEHFKRNPYSPPGLRLEALAIELNRVLSGQPVRVEFLERALCGLQIIVPVRQQPTPEIPEVVAQ